MIKPASWKSNKFVRSRLQAALFIARKNRQERQAAMPPVPPPEPPPEGV